MLSSLPKVMHLLAGRPLLAHVVDTALALDPVQVHIVVGHGKQQIISAFDHPLLNWVAQDQQLGTGHAVQQAMSAIPDGSNALVLYGDVPLIGASNLQQLIAATAAFPLALLTAELVDPDGLGRITRDSSGAVSGIVEQGDCSAEQLAIAEINSGFLCAQAGALRGWLDQIDNNNAQQEYYLTDIVALAYADGTPIAAHQASVETEILGINSRQQLATVERAYQRTQAERLMAAGVTLIDPARIDIRGAVTIGTDSVIDINCVIVGPTEIGKNVSIAPNCIITASHLADGVTVHANTLIENAVLGEAVNVGPFARLRPGTELADGVRIGNFVETKNSKFAAGAKANHLSYVGDATVGENTNIGAGVITCNYDGANKHQTTIGNNVFIGSDSQLIAPVEIEDGATIGAGSTITSKVSKGQLAVSRAQQRQIDGWQRPTKPGADSDKPAAKKTVAKKPVTKKPQDRR